MTDKERKPISVEELLSDYRNKQRVIFKKEKLIFRGVNHKDVYNITAPFQDNGEWVIAGRVESRDSEHSQVVFFVNRNDAWVPRQNAPVFELQDPFFTKIGGEFIFGGVEIFPRPTVQNSLSWRTVFYQGKTIGELERFFEGPDGMKDLRLIELKDGSVGIFTRPQGEKGGRGKIGFTKIESLKDLSIDVINEAPLFNQFLDDEWGGANEIHLLSNGMLGVLGHIARFDSKGNRHYYSMVFEVNPETREYSDIKIIAERADFLEGPSKRPDLVDVVFSGGLIRYPNGKAELYAGISDATAQRITIADPFTQLEN